ncbi:MAG: orotidine-5'-phosphate decarboxylase [Actinobacteria bacterium]|nr:orotidine-5'-phosphate decarboxylase [Actinomycetota bacterium]
MRDGSPVLVALDVASAAEAVALAEAVAPHVGGFKVGLGLLHGPGPGVVGALARIGPVMVDAKLHDIPTQAAAAAFRLGEYGARWVTAHASGGAEMLEAAVAALTDATAGTAGILVETVLTSLDAAALASLGHGDSPGRLVARYTKIAASAGAEGVVCATKELGDVAQVKGAGGLLRVTSGIRPDGPLDDDQRRVATPEEALQRGADLLVVGRPIVAAPDPVAAAASLAARVA